MVSFLLEPSIKKSHRVSKIQIVLFFDFLDKTMIKNGCKAVKRPQKLYNFKGTKGNIRDM